MPVVTFADEACNCIPGVVFDLFDSYTVKLAVLSKVLKIFLQLKLETLPVLLNR